MAQDPTDDNYVKLGSDNDLVLSNKKSLPEPMLTKVNGAI